MSRAASIAFLAMVVCAVGLSFHVECQAQTLLTSFGSYGTGDGQFATPTGVTVGPNGDLWVVDSNLDRVQRFSPSGQFLGKWGTHGGSPGQFVGPTSIAFDAAGHLFVTDTGNGRVQELTESGQFLAQWPIKSKVIAFDSDGNFYTIHPSATQVLKYSSSGVLIARIGDGVGTGPGQIIAADGLALDAVGTLYIVDRGDPLTSFGARVERFTTGGVFLSQWGSVGSASGQFQTPVRIALDSGGFVYVVDNQNSRVQVFTAVGTFVTKWGSAGSGPGQFLNPIGITVDSNGRVLVADTNNSRIQVFGQPPTAAASMSWGRLKALYR